MKNDKAKLFNLTQNNEKRELKKKDDKPDLEDIRRKGEEGVYKTFKIRVDIYERAKRMAEDEKISYAGQVIHKLLDQELAKNGYPSKD